MKISFDQTASSITTVWAAVDVAGKIVEVCFRGYERFEGVRIAGHNLLH